MLECIFLTGCIFGISFSVFTLGFLMGYSKAKNKEEEK